MDETYTRAFMCCVFHRTNLYLQYNNSYRAHTSWNNDDDDNKIMPFFRNGSSWKSTLSLWFVSGCILPQTIFRYSSEDAYGRKVLLGHHYWLIHLHIFRTSKIHKENFILLQAIRMWCMFETFLTGKFYSSIHFIYIYTYANTIEHVDLLFFFVFHRDRRLTFTNGFTQVCIICIFI